MNLVIDVGNSLTKFAVFDACDLVEVETSKLNDYESFIEKVLSKHPSLNKAIVSSVGHFSLNELQSIQNKMEVLVLDSQTKLPFANLYKTPKTLGVDRMALISAAMLNFPKKNTLVIDAGTCVTYDFVTKTADYLGGAISPGIRLRYKSLNDYTANLPLLETAIPDGLVGNSTEQSIHSGVVNGMIKEIDGVVYDYTNKYGDLTVILTGGDGNFLSKQLKNSIFANSNFLLEGLNFILDHNSN